MPIAGFGKSRIPFDMFDVDRSAEEAKRLSKCERIYHRGQDLAWDGKEILAMLLKKHGGISISDEKRAALERIFAIILWGELAAWRISTQLADELEPLEAKMAATAQTHDEARHFYVMHDYLSELGTVPKELDRAPRALLDLVLGTDKLAYKLLGMQLMVETLALTIFQTVRETNVEPVLCELLSYFERDEARHVGLGMQYLPALMQDMSKVEVSRLLAFQCKIIFWSLWETKTLEKEFALLGVDPRLVIERGRRKQLAVTQEAFAVLGVDFNKKRNPLLKLLNGAVELVLPEEENSQSTLSRFRNAWNAMRTDMGQVGIEEFDVHSKHRIRTAKGVDALGERMVGSRNS